MMGKSIGSAKLFNSSREQLPIHPVKWLLIVSRKGATFANVNETLTLIR